MLFDYESRDCGLTPLTLLTLFLLFLFLREKKEGEKKQYANGRQCRRGRQPSVNCVA